MRLAKSFTIEPDIYEYVDAEFFSDTKAGRVEAKSFQKASLRTFGRD
jgi:hypothetical protein